MIRTDHGTAAPKRRVKMTVERTGHVTGPNRLVALISCIAYADPHREPGVTPPPAPKKLGTNMRPFPCRKGTCLYHFRLKCQLRARK